ncbi:MAG: hypothetical protein ABR964_01615 [Tepidisphaeraceae bacterium]|jgi:hypothetical protein
MSLELHVFLKRANLPDRAGWQHEIDAIGLPIQLDAALDPRTNTGFSPVKLKGIASGFELDHGNAGELLSTYPHLRPVVADRDTALSFRWGGDLKECGCVLGAAAALVKAFDAVAYYAEDDVAYKDYQQLLIESRQCL